MKNKKTPLVSIGFPVYNGNSIKKNKFCINISESLKSILNQSYSNIEIIISDNASTDGTTEIIKNLCKNDSRVKYFKQPKILSSVENFNFVLNRNNIYLKPNNINNLMSRLMSNCLIGWTTLGKALKT